VDGVSAALLIQPCPANPFEFIGPEMGAELPEGERSPQGRADRTALPIRQGPETLPPAAPGSKGLPRLFRVGEHHHRSWLTLTVLPACMAALATGPNPVWARINAWTKPVSGPASTKLPPRRVQALVRQDQFIKTGG